MRTKYKLARGSQVREEDFGLLFYKKNAPGFFFISSGDLLSPDFFYGELSLKEWIGKNNKNHISEADLSGLAKMLCQLSEKGVIVEC